uniref:PUB domain-containing protein n=1 Tax=Rhizochromulina marina TaxID=1034831 RepID=A0A7S2RGU6_9STRA
MEGEIKWLFNEFVSRGLDPSDAAARALLAVQSTSADDPRESGMQAAHWRKFTVTQRKGSSHDDTDFFQDARAVVPPPRQPCPLSLPQSGGGQGGDAASGCLPTGAWPLLQLREVRVWESPSEGLVAGLQCVWRRRAGGSDVELLGPRHYLNPRQADRDQRRDLILEDGEAIVAVRGQAGALVDCLVLETSRGRIMTFGGSGGSSFDLTPASASSGPRPLLLCFGGGHGGHLHNITATWVTESGGDFTKPRFMSTVPGMETFLHFLYAPASHALRSHCAALVEACLADGSLAPGLREVLSTALKYAENTHRNPASDKFRRIRLLNKLFDAKIGSRPGGPALLAWLAFNELRCQGEPATDPLLVRSDESPSKATLGVNLRTITELLDRGEGGSGGDRGE